MQQQRPPLSQPRGKAGAAAWGLLRLVLGALPRGPSGPVPIPVPMGTVTSVGPAPVLAVDPRVLPPRGAEAAGAWTEPPCPPSWAGTCSWLGARPMVPRT